MTGSCWPPTDSALSLVSYSKTTYQVARQMRTEDKGKDGKEIATCEDDEQQKQIVFIAMGECKGGHVIIENDYAHGCEWSIGMQQFASS